MQHFQGKRTVITGAASGIGAELLRLLAAAGADCVAVDQNRAGLETLQKSVPQPIHIIQTDLSVPEQRTELMRQLGPVDIFFANAGFAGYGPFTQTSVEQIQALTQVNWLAPVEALHYLVQHNPKPFQFVVTASAMSFAGIPHYALYSGLKSALHSFADTYRFENPKNVKLSVVYPVATRTAFFERKSDGQKVPWPSQTPRQVARAIVKGVACGRRGIYPSRTFFVMNGFYFIHRALFWPYRWYYRG